MSEFTPLMRQYNSIKKNYPDSILFFRLGDFYEMFGDDAHCASRILEITLTKRQKVPMCGIPYHAANSYIARLIKDGQKVAICEQVEDARAAKGIVKREVIRLITPGTILEENLLEAKNNNFLLSFFPDLNDNQLNDSIGLAAVDVSTGEFLITELAGENLLKRLSDEISRFKPSECLIPQSFKENKSMSNFLQNCHLYCNFYDDWNFDFNNAYQKLIEHFKVNSLKGFGCEGLKSGISAAGAIIGYLKETQKTALNHIGKVRYYTDSDYMMLDESTQNNLELVENLQDKSQRRTLLEVFDLTVTSSGARLLRRNILLPLLSRDRIEARLNAVEKFYDNNMLRKEIRDNLAKTSDLERLISRINLGTAKARDLVGLKNSLKLIPKIKELLVSVIEGKISEITDENSKLKKNILIENVINNLYNLKDIYNLIEESIVDEPPVLLNEGGIIKKGYNTELDNLREITSDGKTWIARLERQEKERTGINSLKVGYTTVFGYYIEVTKANLSSVPAHYIRKQTLVNAERFVTPELKDKESLILGAEEKVVVLEQEIFKQVCQEITRQTLEIQTVAHSLANLDFITTLAQVAVDNNYVQPKILDEGCIIIKEGRHPVVEKMLLGAGFISNDTFVDTKDNQILIITGPNMAGKSTYIRQVALIVLLAHIGSFVPAKEAEIGLVDRIFSRIGAMDNLARGESTFMVEMNETANILNNATEKSLIVLDEVGRGTSTFDGISIAWSVVEYLNNKGQESRVKSQGSNNKQGGPRTLFATHYFELTELSQTLSGVKNYNVAVREWNDEVVFLRKIVAGSADKSYGIYVANLAGLPPEVIERAKDILDTLEKNSYRDDGIPKLAQTEEKPKQLGLFAEDYHPIMKEIKEININELTPIEALTKLEEWKEKLSKGNI